MKICPTCNYPNPDRLSSCFNCSAGLNPTFNSAALLEVMDAFSSRVPMETLVSGVGDGRDIIATCDFVDIGKNGSYDVTLVLTASDLYVLHIQRPGLGIIAKVRIDLNQIKSCTLVYVAQGFTGRNMVQLIIAGSNFEAVQGPGESFNSSLEMALQRIRSLGGDLGFADQIEKLSRLVDEGTLTEDEFQRAKALYLGRPIQQRDALLLTLRSLNNLYKSGVLSESEFNTKKWDILSKLNN